MLEATGNKVFAYDDAAVFSMIDSIAGLEHRADARELGVDADVGFARTFAAERLSAIANANYGHLAGILATRDDSYGIGAGGQGGMRIFSTVADVDAID